MEHYILDYTVFTNKHAVESVICFVDGEKSKMKCLILLEEHSMKH